MLSNIEENHHGNGFVDRGGHLGDRRHIRRRQRPGITMGNAATAPLTLPPTRDR
jgi:hypothetical protein